MIRICTCLICLLLAACFPGANGYYRPSASTGRLVNVCGGVTPAETIEFEHAGVRVRVSSDGHELRLLIQVPGSATASFETAELEIKYNGERLVVPIPEHVYYDPEGKTPVSLPATSPLVGKDEAVTFPFVSAATRVFRTLIKLPPRTGDIYTVKLPAILVNEVKHELPEIQFQKELGIGLYPVNC